MNVLRLDDAYLNQVLDRHMVTRRLEILRILANLPPANEVKEGRVVYLSEKDWDTLFSVDDMLGILMKMYSRVCSASGGPRSIKKSLRIESKITFGAPL